MSLRVVILGAGFGGLELSARLSEEVADQVEVTLIERSDHFVFGFSKLDVMFGRARPEEVRLHYRDLAMPSVEWRQEVVRSIDPARRRVVTDRGTHDADVLVVALGADLDPAATPGLAEGGFEYYTPQGAQRAGEALAGFEAGTVLIGVLGDFFKCPPAPNETALMLHDHLERRGIRDRATIRLLTPFAMPIPISRETSTWIEQALAERDVELRPGTGVSRLDPERRVAHLRDGTELDYDLFLGIPIHRAPAALEESGLCVDGWVAVDPATLETRFEGVFAVGDVTSAPVPRAGVIAEGEARTVADVLVARLRGGPEPPPYAGSAVCYMESGGSRVARVDVNFLSGSAPTARFLPPTQELAQEKREFAATRRRRWFGAQP